ncbi:hypothetical protein F4802DRAFT_457087 [Xylaria palmicola]|nr:hypothetical protein F4802DRAFT_457087 [Xylaria palmicola]
MMASSFGAGVPLMTLPTYTTYPILDDFSRQQIAFPDSSRRIPRYPNGQRTPGAMRVAKPRSANNSPQAMLARRRTLVNDSNQARRRQQAILQQMQETSPYYGSQHDQVKRNTRPVSWHPSSQVHDAQQLHMEIPQVDMSQLSMAMPTLYTTKEGFAGYPHLPPTPAAYSGYTSPVSGFSPLLSAYGPATQPTAMPTYISGPWIPTAQVASSCYNPSGSPDNMASCPTYDNQAFDWHTYSLHELQACTAPPTPDEFQAIQQPQEVPPEESIPYQSLEPENEEEEGEILVGMGLYDLPTKADTDPELDHYHTTTSQLLDTTYRMGKGWKLEEAWEPPASDDEDSEEDADGEDQEEDAKTTESPPAE